MFEDGRCFLTLDIRNRQRDHALRLRENFFRLDALGRVAFEPRHFAVLPCGEPVLKFSGVIRRGRRGAAAIIKAQFAGALADQFLQGVGRGGGGGGPFRAMLN